MAIADLPLVQPLMRGDDEAIDFKVFEPGEDPSDPGATPQNLGGCTLRFSAKFDLSDATPVVSKSSVNAGEIVIDNAATGEGHVVIDKDDLVGVTYPATLIGDLEVTDADDKTYTMRLRIPVELDVST